MSALKQREWRYISLATSDGAGNMAIDEAILIARSQDLVPNTIRMYKWNPPAVSIGYFQKINDVVDAGECRNLGIDVVRRISGGGAVYHSGAELTYSVVVDQNGPGIPMDPIPLYKKLSAAVVTVPLALGLDACFDAGHPGVCPNIVVAGKKISGNAQARKKGSILQHGTLLLDCDLEVMARVLKIPFGIIDAKVTTLKRELGGEFGEKYNRIENNETLQETLLQGFKEYLGAKPVNGELTEFERNIAEELKAKYSSEEWTEMR